MNETSNTTEARDIMDLGSALSEPVCAAIEPGNSVPFVVVPEGYKVHDLESLFAAPTRARGEYMMNDANSFVALVNDLKSGNTRLYGVLGREGVPTFRAVFNDNAGEYRAPGWRDHVAIYNCPLSTEWKTWVANNGKSMNQEQFAKFIEDNAIDIASPPAADMIEISRTLEAKKKVNFSSGTRLDNGQTQITYEEEIQGTAAKGQLQIPQEFTVGLAVLEGGPKYAVAARLRYRIDGAKLSMWYDLLRPHKIIEDATMEVRAAIAVGTGLTVFNGMPA